ncbi:MAG: cytochrome c3 family protein [Desulfobacteraceae bacterium]|jgi:predicted CXXCH cytochrome family protein
MPNKKTIISFTFLFGLIVFFGSGLLTAQEIPEEIILDQEVYKPNRKGPVTFSHQGHAEDYEVACNECHHFYEDGKNIWEEGDYVEKCYSCHDPFDSEGNIKKLRIAFHKNCKGCHKRMKKEGISDEAPYRNCKDCHEIER